MPFSLKDAWTTLVSAEDYDAHMAAVGQAPANAEHIAEFLARTQPARGARLLIAGAGTGQFFEYLRPSAFEPFRAVFTDVNPRFLAQLRRRHPAAVCVLDDLEQSSLGGPCHAVMATLVLEHIDWRKGIAALTASCPQCLYLVVQQNPPGMATAVTPGRTPSGSMKIFASVHPALLDTVELSGALRETGYRLEAEIPKPVADGKTMLGLLYRRA